jgi:hypothetical protein
MIGLSKSYKIYGSLFIPRKEAAELGLPSNGMVTWRRVDAVTSTGPNGRKSSKPSTVDG